MKKNYSAFTLVEGRLACITTQAPAKAQRCQYVITSECEAIQPIEKDVNRHKSTGTKLNHFKSGRVYVSRSLNHSSCHRHRGSTDITGSYPEPQ